MDLSSIELADSFNKNRWKVWVLAPSLETEDPLLNYYYDFSQSMGEYHKVFEELKLPWVWKNVHLSNYKQIIQAIADERPNVLPLVINLCDGDEINGVPGISVIQALEDLNLIYTGSDKHFYTLTTSKIDMKKAFDAHKISTPPWMVIPKTFKHNGQLWKYLTPPIIIKPAISAGSMGIGLNSVVHNDEELRHCLQQIRDGYRGWDLVSGGLIAEEFIIGREFTSFFVGSGNNIDHCQFYTPVERVFNQQLPKTEQFLSFERLWEIYENEPPMENDKNFYNYHLPSQEYIEPINTLSWHAYKSLGGKGYTRVDLRMDEVSGKLFILEVNAQCGLSEDENFTSIGAILRYSNKTFTQLIHDIMKDAYIRAIEKHIV